MEPSIKQKLYIMFMEQDNWSFNPVIFFKSTVYGFHLYNCYGLQTHQAKLLTIHAAKDILCIIVHLFFGCPASIGYDKTMQCEEGRAKWIMQCEEWWDVEKELYKSPLFVGQNTRCWVVLRKEKDSNVPTRLILKDTWTSAPNAENEYKILKRIKEENINGRQSLPQLHSWNYIRLPPGLYDGDTIEFTRHHYAHASGVVPWQHCHLLSGPVAYPLSCFVNLKDIMGALHDALQGTIFHFFSIRYMVLIG